MNRPLVAALREAPPGTQLMSTAFTSTLSKFALAAAPFALGAFIGFCVALIGLWRWFAGNTRSTGVDLFASLRRVGLQCAVLGTVFTVVAATWLSPYLPNETVLSTAQGALWGFAFGILAGVRWVYRRGER